MKRYKTILKLGKDICLWDDTPELFDEVNITQANRIAKVFLTMLYAYGYFGLTREKLMIALLNDSKIKGTFGLGTAKRVSELLLNKFKFYWFPFSLHRWQLSRIIKMYDI